MSHSPTSIESPDRSDEKGGISKLEHVDTALYDPDAGLSDEEKAVLDKKLVRMLDLKLIPWVSYLSLLSSQPCTDYR
jgi:hypothetical protein